tara:strand:- start:783 stop:1085 length:303 start_codon:yes stop_codon:yes gene_type:complete
LLGKNKGRFINFPVYIIELALKFCPLPLSVQRKELKDAEALYHKVKEAMERAERRVLELSCEQVEDKKISFLVTEVLAIQIYEKTAASSGVKRPGFSFDA